MRKTAVAVAASLAMAVTASADYDTHPGFSPAMRCVSIPPQPDDNPDPGIDTSDAGGLASRHCQPLYWDFPAATAIGARATSAPIGGYPHGITDRPPPMYVASEGGTLTGYERNRTSDGTLIPERAPLCASDPDLQAILAADPGRVEDYIPYWKRTGQDLDQDGYEDLEVDCRRGTRIHYGPWSFGTASTTFERSPRAVLRVENSARLDHDEEDGIIDESNRREWFVGMEIYNHVGSHHANAWDPVKPCNDPDNPAYASSAECQGDVAGTYQYDNYDASGCRSDAWATGEGPKASCEAYGNLNNPSQWRAATQFPGRFEVEIPGGRAIPVLENQLWPMEHHVVSRGFYFGLNRDFNKQEGGVIGEIVVQVFAAPFDDSYQRISVLFETVTEAASLYVPPFTIMPNVGVWYAPYDLELALLTTHSHKRTVRSWADVLPANPIRSQDENELCGGSAGGDPATHVFESYHWDDANTCKYYESPDGNIILRKGQGLSFGCLFNNGVRPTNDLPPDAAAAVSDSVIGRQLLYGEQPESIYRVKYGCEETANVPPGSPPLDASRTCTPPPADHPDCAADANGDGFCDDDFSWVPEDQSCTGDAYTGRCVPSSIVFANAEDEMCILVGMYWPLQMPVDTDADVDGSEIVRPSRAISGGYHERPYESPEDFQQAFEEFQPDVLPLNAGEAVHVGEEPVIVDPSKVPEDPSKTGTPGRLPKSPSDIGKCEGCSKLVPPTI